MSPDAPESASEGPEARLEWVEKSVVADLLKKHTPELVHQDRAPGWAIATAQAFLGTLFVYDDLSFEGLLKQVQGDVDLQNAVTGARRMRAGAFDIIDMIQNWRKIP